MSQNNPQTNQQSNATGKTPEQIEAEKKEAAKQAAANAKKDDKKSGKDGDKDPVVPGVNAAGIAMNEANEREAAAARAQATGVVQQVQYTNAGNADVSGPGTAGIAAEIVTDEDGKEVEIELPGVVNVIGEPLPISVTAPVASAAEQARIDRLVDEGNLPQGTLDEIEAGRAALQGRRVNDRLERGNGERANKT